MISPLAGPAGRFLAFIGRHAAPAYALSIVLGLALPPLAAFLRPAIPVALFAFILLSFARANLPGIRSVIARPGRLALGLTISILLPPLLAGAALASLPSLDPGIRLGIALMAAAPPLMASPVYAGVLGFENSFALAILVLGMVAAPLVSPAFASFLAGAEVPIAPLALAQRLVVFIGGGMAAGLAVRALAGAPRIAALRSELDGIGVVLFFFFAIAAMDGVIAATLTAPGLVLTMIGISSVLFAAMFALGYLMLLHLGFNDRFSGSIAIGLRNMGLLIAPIISLVPANTFLYFALAQVPIYVAPVILRQAKRWLEPGAAPTGRG